MFVQRIKIGRSYSNNNDLTRLGIKGSHFMYEGKKYEVLNSMTHEANLTNSMGWNVIGYTPDEPDTAIKIRVRLVEEWLNE